MPRRREARRTSTHRVSSAATNGAMAGPAGAARSRPTDCALTRTRRTSGSDRPPASVSSASWISALSRRSRPGSRPAVRAARSTCWAPGPRPASAPPVDGGAGTGAGAAADRHPLRPGAGRRRHRRPAARSPRRLPRRWRRSDLVDRRRGGCRRAGRLRDAARDRRGAGPLDRVGARVGARSEPGRPALRRRGLDAGASRGPRRARRGPTGVRRCSHRSTSEGRQWPFRLADGLVGRAGRRTRRRRGRRCPVDRGHRTASARCDGRTAKREESGHRQWIRHRRARESWPLRREQLAVPASPPPRFSRSDPALRRRSSDPGDLEDPARKDQVRIGQTAPIGLQVAPIDLRDLRVAGGVAQLVRRDLPERVAADHRCRSGRAASTAASAGRVRVHPG